MKRWINLDVSELPDRYELAKEAFTFACFTGLRYSDVVRISLDNVERDKNRINIIAQKTSRQSYIEFNDMALSLINKYGKKVSHFDAPLFPIPDNYTYNKQLKKLARMANFNSYVLDCQYVGTELVTKKNGSARSSHRISQEGLSCVSVFTRT